jgi:hypothetical protein
MLGATSYAIAGTDTLHLVADWQLVAGEEQQDENLLPRLMSFLLGGLRAPLPQLDSAETSSRDISAKKEMNSKS